MPYISDQCRGEKCWCGIDAVAKVAEVILYDDPNPARHELTAYICKAHFIQMFGPAAARRFETPRELRT